jgi:hypothetical protein
MLPAVIVTAEIAFWALLLAGLFARYRLGRRRLGAVLLALTPAVDLVVLVASVVDLRDGATATSWHGLAAIYIGVSIAFGSRIVAWADARFAQRFADVPPAPRAPQEGREHARREREGWYRHLLAYAIGGALMLAAIALVADAERTEVLRQMLQVWSLVLAIDFAWSFSYTLWPREVRATR